MSDRTVVLWVHERQPYLSRGGMWPWTQLVCLVSPSCYPRYRFEGQEGFAFEVIRPQDVVVQNRDHQASPWSLALIKGHQAGTWGGVKLLQYLERGWNLWPEKEYWPETYNSNTSSKRGLRSQALIRVQQGSTSGKVCWGSRHSCTYGSLKPSKTIKIL